MKNKIFIILGLLCAILTFGQEKKQLGVLESDAT